MGDKGSPWSVQRCRCLTSSSRQPNFFFLVRGIHRSSVLLNIWYSWRTNRTLKQQKSLYFNNCLQILDTFLECYSQIPQYKSLSQEVFCLLSSSLFFLTKCASWDPVSKWLWINLHRGKLKCESISAFLSGVFVSSYITITFWIKSLVIKLPFPTDCFWTSSWEWGGVVQDQMQKTQLGNCLEIVES